MRGSAVYVGREKGKSEEERRDRMVSCGGDGGRQNESDGDKYARADSRQEES